MTTSTRCRRCGARQQGIVVQCPCCGGDMEAWVTISALPSHEEAIPEARSRQPQGCYCGQCEEFERGMISRCAGPALVMRMRSGWPITHEIHPRATP